MEKETRLVVKHASGLHARPASLFVQLSNRYASEIQVTNLKAGKGPVSAKSILSVLTLGICQGNEILISAKGNDADEAIHNLTELVNSNFGEEADQ